jgi:hypothetical protein
MVVVRCLNCQRRFKRKNIRHLYCNKCARGIVGIRNYHSEKGDAVKVGIKTSILRKRSAQFLKEVNEGFKIE